jgi:GntR family transcriptional regulator/MocR family aminotransferase
LKLLHWAKQTNGIIIEDDYDCDFLYEGRPIPALQALDTAGSVIYLGTFSKALAPALRLSYIILPPGLLKRFENEFPYYDQPVSRLTQKTMELFMEQGHFDKHVRKMRKVYKHKRETLLDAIHSNLGDRVELSGTATGLHVIVKIKSERSTVELIRLAAQSGVRVHAVSDYEARLHGDQLESIKQDEVHSFLLGFGGLSSAQITVGISRIAIAWGIHSSQ